MKIWIDIKNVHEPLFFKALIKNMPDYHYYITCRDFAEIVDLIKRYNIDPNIIGGRPEGSMIKRTLGFALRVIKLYLKVPNFDVSLNHASIWAIYTSKLRFRKNITITDNEIDHLLNRRMFKHVDYLLIPKAIPKKIVIEDNMKEERIYQYNGFKEDIYIADFTPDPNFLKNLPFKEFVTIRPESIQATYYPKGIPSITPLLFKEFNKRKINMLFLPRYKSDKEYAKGFSNIYIPPKPLNGLDICYYSNAVLTGAGTFAREAGILGVPAVQFFPAENAAVDKELIRLGRMFYSRDPKEIVKYVLKTKRKEFNREKSIAVKNEVTGIVKNILKEVS